MSSRQLVATAIGTGGRHSARTPPGNRLAAALSILVLPMIAVLSLPNTLLQAGTLDPFVYLGYVDHYADLLQRFGRTYYSTRIAYIFPEAAFRSLFGDPLGYLLLRYAALAAAAAALFGIARRHVSITAGVCASAWLLFNPWTLRSLMYYHYDGFAVVYLLVAFSLVMAPVRHRSFGAFLGGAAFACAVNCNLFVLAVGGLFLPAWLILDGERGMRPTAARVAISFGGFVVTYALLDLSLAIAFPDYAGFIEGPALQEALTLLSGGAKQWFKPLGAYFSEGNYHFLIPAFLATTLAVAALAMRRARQPLRSGALTAASLVYMVLIWALYLAMHFGIRAGLLTLLYYQSYFIPATSLVLIALLGEVLPRAPPALVRIALPGIGAAHILLWLSTRYWLDGAAGLTFVSFAAASAVATLSCLVLARRAAVTMVALASLVLIMPFAYYDAPDSASSSLRALLLHSSEQAALESDVVAGARFLEKIVSRLDPDLGDVGFWYGSESEDRYLNSVQSTYLWEYSRVVGATSAGLPMIDGAFRNLVASKRFLVFLTRSAEGITAGTDAIEAAGYRTITIDRQNFLGRVWGYEVAMLEVIPPELDIGAVISRIPLSGLSPVSEGKVLVRESDSTLISPQARWAYGAIVALPAEIRSARQPLLLHVRLAVEEGRIGIAIARDRDDQFLTEISVSPSSAPVRDVYIEIARPEDAASIVFRNWSAKGASRIRMLSIEIAEPAPSRHIVL